MSAHMESKAHFDALVTHGLTKKTDGRYLRPMDDRALVWHWDGKTYSLSPNDQWADVILTPDALGQMLYDENFKSVGYRYGGDEKMTGEHEQYDYQPIAPLAPEQIIMACSGYIYQSCEHPDFYKSNAYAYVIALKARMADILASDATGWSIHEEDVKRVAFV